MSTKLEQSFVKVPKRVLLIEEKVNDLYEVSITLKDVIGAVAKVTKFVAEQGVNIRSGILSTPSKVRACRRVHKLHRFIQSEM